LAAAAIVLAAAGACRPDFEDRAALVLRTRILAVQAEPPESLPGRAVRYRALVAGPQGTLAFTPLAWSFCTEPKPLTENNVVSSRCLATELAPLIESPGAILTASTPPDACRLFGPDPPPGMFRPRDPDVTGGYYQPLRVEVAAGAGAGATAGPSAGAAAGPERAIALERVRCNLARAPADLAQAFRMHYLPNQNPVIEALALLSSESPPQPIAPDRVPPGASIELEVRWPSESAERYLLFDVDREALLEQREALDASWFATAGTIRRRRTGPDRDGETRARTTWLAPARAGQAFIWVVLRDSRGGLAFRDLEVTVGSP
jgi:hypothetical protein